MLFAPLVRLYSGQPAPPAVVPDFDDRDHAREHPRLCVIQSPQELFRTVQECPGLIWRRTLPFGAMMEHGVPSGREVMDGHWDDLPGSEVPLERSRLFCVRGF